jgi:diguanylate cyclase (GGDEF)-like protein
MTETSGKAQRVLIVEDESIIANDLKDVINGLGFEVVGIADSAVDALVLVEKKRPDIALLDIRLRGSGDGVELAEELRSQHDVPSIFLTAHSDPTFLARAYSAKPYGFLAKPVRAIELSSTLNIALQLHQANRRLRDHAEQLRHLSMHDGLTELYNRRAFLTLAAQQLKAAQRSGRPLVLLYLDLDDFKSVNDRRGHALGDQVLRTAADSMRKTFRAADVLARIGGDEFAVLSQDSDAQVAQAMCLRLTKTMAETNTHAALEVDIQFSVGIAIYNPETPESLEQLLDRADMAMYANKQREHGDKRAASNE